jgi:nicotinamidase-related amidase
VIAPRDCVLVLVDYQERLLPAIHLGTRVLAEAERLADCARALGIRVVGTEQNPHGLGANAPAIRERCATTIAKMHFDACRDGLVPALRNSGGALPRDVVVAGCETHVCLLQTALGLRRAGLPVRIAVNACGARHALDHDLALGRLQQSGAVLASVETIAFDWLQTCEHPRFREVLEILKAPRG